MSLRRIDELHDAIRRLTAMPQTVAREIEMDRLRHEKLLLEGRRQVEVTQLTRTLIDAYITTGRMRAVRWPELSPVPIYDTAAVNAEQALLVREMHGDPVRTGRAIQDYWNVRGEAERLAGWSVR